VLRKAQAQQLPAGSEAAWAHAVLRPEPARFD
jgi:hypothetical protein